MGVLDWLDRQHISEAEFRQVISAGYLNLNDAETYYDMKQISAGHNGLATDEYVFGPAPSGHIIVIVEATVMNSIGKTQPYHILSDAEQSAPVKGVACAKSVGVGDAGCAMGGKDFITLSKDWIIRIQSGSGGGVDTFMIRYIIKQIR